VVSRVRGGLVGWLAGVRVGGRCGKEEDDRVGGVSGGETVKATLKPNT